MKKTKLTHPWNAGGQHTGPVPTPVLALILSGGLLCGLALLMLLAPGCARLPAGSEPHEHAGTAELVARGTPLMVTVTPPPWNSIAEAALGLISAGLATWNVQQHRRLAALEAAKATPADNDPSQPRPPAQAANGGVFCFEFHWQKPMSPRLIRA